MYQTIIDVAVFAILVFIAFSPAFVFRLIDKYFLGEKIELFDSDLHLEPVTSILDESSSAFNTDGRIDHDQKVLNNLKSMIKKTKKKDAKRVWKMKLAEFERKIQWLAVANKANGHETVCKIAR